MHYACSDIHGQYDTFLRMLQLIEFTEEDEMYILGDVIDRGPKPIELLLYICEHQNIKLLMGNHEYMMIRAARHKEMNLWARNGCRTTLHQLQNLSETSIEKILQLIEKLPLLIPNVQVEEKSYYLTHAGMIDQIITEPLYLSEVENEQIFNIVWDRKLAMGEYPQHILSAQVYEYYENSIVLFGHTISDRCAFGKTDKEGGPCISRNRNIINLDCGCAKKQKLGCLRLEDFKEFYLNV